VSSECHLDKFDMIPARKRHPAQRHCLPCNGTKFSTVPCNGGPFSITHRIPWRHTGTAPWTCCLTGGTDTPRPFTPWCIKAGRYSHKVGTLLSWCMQLKGNMTGIILTGTLPFLPWLLSFWQLWSASYPYFFRNLLHKVSCNTRPVVNSTSGNKSLSPPEVSPEQPIISQLHSNGSGSQSLPTLYS
jgi:hypothetical protein